MKFQMSALLFTLLLVLLTTLMERSSAFIIHHQPITVSSSSSTATSLSSSNSRSRSSTQVNAVTPKGRRAFLIISGAVLFTSSSSSINPLNKNLHPNAANAAITPTTSNNDPLFKKNPLTNPVLEQIRIWDQDVADNVKYSGELAPGVITDTYAQLLVPIVKMQQDLINVDKLLHEFKLQEAQELLNQKSFEKVQFKKVFNKFADNIYYSDPDRANVYLGGGAVPKSEQSIAYLLRNDILTNIEDLQAEVAYIIKQQEKNETKIETEDLFLFSKNIVEGMSKYLALVPPKELETANAALGL